MRIISLVPSVTETLFELGLENQLIAITRFCRLPADRVKLKPKVGGTKNPKLDKILEMKPDIVIMDRDENRKEDAEFLRQHNIKIFTTFPRSIEDAIHTIRDLGEAFAAEDRANQIIDEIKERMSSFQPPSRKRTLILIWRKPYMTANGATYVHAVCSFFGFDNVFVGSPERYPRITAEEICAANPEVVLMPDEPYPFRPRNIEEFKQTFPELEAVGRSQFAIFDGTYITWPGYGTLRALREFPALIRELER